MAHVKSETVRRKNKAGVTRWFNIDTVGADKGRNLGGPTGFKNRVDAERAAERMSPKMRVKPRRGR